MLTVTMELMMNLAQALQNLKATIREDFPVGGDDDCDELGAYLQNFVKYVNHYPTISYYSYSKLFDASRCTLSSEVKRLTEYLSSDRIAFLNVHYCYYAEDSDNPIPVDPEVYTEALEGITPVNAETGNEIEDYNPSRLGYHCYLRHEA